MKIQSFSQKLILAKRLGKTAKTAAKSGLRLARGEKLSPQLLKENFEELGATYIKLGQFIASAPSFFPKEYVEVFADCFDKAAPVAFDRLEAVLDTELAHIGGARAFLRIDPTPIASASVAQAHRGVLKSGEIVAIKIQRPDAKTVIDTDLRALRTAFWLLEKTAPAFSALSLTPIVDEIKTRMSAECDFLAESQALQRFGEFLQSAKIADVVVPKVYRDYSAKRVLTMEFIDGVSLLQAPACADADGARLLNAALDAWFLALMQSGEFHADVHAGNLLYTKDGKIAFLDFGLMGYVKPDSLAACFRFVAAFAAGDFLAMAQAMADIGVVDPSAFAKDKAIQALANDLRSFFESGQAHRQNPSAALGDVSQIGKRHGVRFPKDFALLVKQTLYFDRFIETLAPNASLFTPSRRQWLGV